MTNGIKYIGLSLLGLVVGLLLGVNLAPQNVGGVYNQVINEFRQGLKAGTTNQFVVTNTGAVSTAEFTQGGGQCTITDANGGTYTLTQAELNGCNYLYMTASGAGQEVIALTLPAISTMTTLLPNVGDYREWLIDASDLAAATTTTITLGTGIDMIAVTAAEDVIDGGEYSELRCWRKSDNDVACVTSELINSD